MQHILGPTQGTRLLIIPLESYRTQLSSPAIYSPTDWMVWVSYHRTPDGPVECTGDPWPSLCRPTYQLCKNLSVGRHRLEYQWHKILVLAGSINDISHGKTLAGSPLCAFHSIFIWSCADMTGICLAQGISDITVSLRFSSTYVFPSFRCLGPLSRTSADLPLCPFTYCTTFLSTPAPNPCS